MDLVEQLADWSAWVPLTQAIVVAPRLPGVYMARRGSDGPFIYVGMAGERAGRDGNRSPKGLWGRLSVYARGKGAVSGLGEAAFDRALADPAWVAAQLVELHRDGPKRATAWAQAAIAWADIHIRWATTKDRAAADALERLVLQTLADHELWNRDRR